MAESDGGDGKCGAIMILLPDDFPVTCLACGKQVADPAQLPVYGPARWVCHDWTCRHGRTWECPECYAKGHPPFPKCPKCGCGEEYT